MADQLNTATAFFEAWDAGQEYFEVKTSGSTGEPKTISIHRKRMIASAECTGNYLQIQPSDTIHCCLPIDKIGGLMQLVRSKIWNVPIAISSAVLNPLENGAKGNIISVTSLQLYHIINNSNTAELLNNYRIVLIGGGHLNKDLEHKLLAFKPIFYHTYGMTETCSHIAMRKCNIEEFFTPLNGVELNTNSHDCLTINCAQTGLEWVETHDIVHFNGKQFKIIGRLDNIINTGGLKIQPEMVENYLNTVLKLPENSIFCTGISDSILGEKLVLVVNRNLLPSDVELPAEFPEKNWKPKIIHYLPDFIFTSTGKVDRKLTAQLIH